MRFRLVLATCLLAAAARASNITDELAINSTQATDTNPRSGYLSDSLNASFDLTEQWSLNAGATLTLENQTPAAARGQFGSSGNAVTDFTAGMDWDATDHWTFGVTGDWSPRSTQYAGTQVVGLNALVQSQSLQYSGGADVSYDTAGDSDLEWTFSGGITGTHFDSNQRVTRVRTDTGGSATAAQISAYCAATNKCSRALLATLRDTPATLDSQRFSASATMTAWKDSDFTLVGDYYHYNQDPAAVGYFSVATAGRTFITGGNGVPIAPLQFTVRPEVLHRFGAFSVKLWVTAGKYVSGTGQSTTGLGAKLQYKFTKRFRLWATVSGQRDLDEQGNPTQSGGLAMGAGYRF